MRFSILNAGTATILLFATGVVVAAASNTTDSATEGQQDCAKFDCLEQAVTASECSPSNATCICTSPIFSANFTTCATKTCNMSATDTIVQDAMGVCPNGVAKSGGASLDGARLGTAVLSAVCLIFSALLM